MSPTSYQLLHPAIIVLNVGRFSLPLGDKLKELLPKLAGLRTAIIVSTIYANQSAKANNAYLIQP